MNVKAMDSDSEWVRAEVNYIRNARPDADAALTFVTEDESQSTMVTLPGVVVPIHDVRGVQTSLDDEGFKLVSHKSAVRDFDLIEEDPQTDQLYIQEMTALLQEVTGADRVIMLGGGKKRYGARAKDKLEGLKNALPAMYPHGDTTDASAVAQCEMISSFVPGLDLANAKRWVLYNMWRPTTPPPHDYPLAVCDARTIAKGDAVTVVAHTETREQGAGAHDTNGYVHNAGHRWCSFRDMTPEEVIVFKTHDSDPTKAHQVAHTAFLNPTCPPDAPTRGSVEMRALAVYS